MTALHYSLKFIVSCSSIFLFFERILFTRNFVYIGISEKALRKGMFTCNFLKTIKKLPKLSIKLDLNKSVRERQRRYVRFSRKGLRPKLLTLLLWHILTTHINGLTGILSLVICPPHFISCTT